MFSEHWSKRINKKPRRYTDKVSAEDREGKIICLNLESPQWHAWDEAKKYRLEK